MVRLLALLLLLSASPARADPWPEQQQLLMWQDRTAAQWAGLKSLGFTGAKLRATGGQIDTAARATLRQAGVPFYLENTATDFYAAYHRFTPGKPVNWLYDAAKARYRAGDPTAFIREPGLSDPVWIARIRDRLAAIVHGSAPDRPLFYNLGDESGIADLAAAWDFDTAPTALAGFRAWLQTEYPDLAALNRQWGTSLTSWDAATPELTDAAIARPDQNFSAWSDWKAYMDHAFAAAVRQGTAAVHAADPAARSALEGGQVPGWGGYDYALLAPAIDVMEIYDYGQSLDLALAHNPALIALRTSFGRGPRETFAAWRALLHGARGTVVWDEDDDVAHPDGTPGPRGHDIAAWHTATAAVAPALRVPAPDPVAIYVNQASFRVTWLLDRRAGDHDWAARDAEREYDDNAWRASRRVLLTRLGELGVMPRLISTLDDAALQGVRVLFLPHAIAMPDADVAAVRAFEAAGGTVLADTEPGLFDGHGRRRTTPPLPDVPHPEAVRPLGSASNPTRLSALALLLRQAGAPPRAMFLGPDGQLATGIEARWFRTTDGQVLSLQAAEPFAGPARLSLQLPPGTVTNLRQPNAPPATPIALDGVEPTILLLRPP